MSSSSIPYISALQTFYNTIGSHYHTINFHAESAQRLIDAASPALKPGSWVLDLATGTGNVAFAAARKVGSTGRVLGIDISDEFLRLAADAAKQLGVEASVDFLHRDVGQLARLPEPYAKGRCFDVVTAGSAISLFPAPGAVLDVVATQLLKKGGVFVADVPGTNVPAKVFLDVAVPRGFQAPLDPGWLSDPEGCFRELFEKSVLELETVVMNELSSEGKWDASTHEAVEKLWQSSVVESTWVSFGIEELDSNVLAEIKKAWVEELEEYKGAGGFIVAQRTQCIAVAMCPGEHVATKDPIDCAN